MRIIIYSQLLMVIAMHGCSSNSECNVGEYCSTSYQCSNACTNNATCLAKLNKCYYCSSAACISKTGCCISDTNCNDRYYCNNSTNLCIFNTTFTNYSCTSNSECSSACNKCYYCSKYGYCARQFNCCFVDSDCGDRYYCNMDTNTCEFNSSYTNTVCASNVSCVNTFSKCYSCSSGYCFHNELCCNLNSDCMVGSCSSNTNTCVLSCATSSNCVYRYNKCYYCSQAHTCSLNTSCCTSNSDCSPQYYCNSTINSCSFNLSYTNHSCSFNYECSSSFSKCYYCSTGYCARNSSCCFNDSNSQCSGGFFCDTFASTCVAIECSNDASCGALYNSCYQCSNSRCVYYADKCPIITSVTLYWLLIIGVPLISIAGAVLGTIFGIRRCRMKRKDENKKKYEDKNATSNIPVGTAANTSVENVTMGQPVSNNIVTCK